MISNRGEGTFFLRAVVVVALLCKAFSVMHSYVLFHTLSEFVSIVISFGIFTFAWVTRRHLRNDLFLFLGVSYLFVGVLDTLHTLSYKGMNLFTPGRFYANQIWIGTRFLESVALFFSFDFLDRKFSGRLYWSAAGAFAFSVALVLSVFYLQNFPECFVEGKGQTNFKIYSEVLVCAILGAAFFRLNVNSDRFDPETVTLMKRSIVLTMFSELSFTLYISNYDLVNMAGHYFKIFSFYFIYGAIIRLGIEKPFNTIFSELSSKNAELERLTLELKESNQAKDRIFSLVSHDLRNPFTPILGMADILSHRAAEMTSEVIATRAAAIHESASRYYDMLENLLQWSRVQMGRFEISPGPIVLRHAVTRTAELFEERAGSKEISVSNDIPEDLVAMADDTAISSIVQNLLANAIKFTKPGGKIEFSGISGPETISFSISDTGTGIPPAKLSVLFSLDSTISSDGTEGEVGTGLGLNLCMKLLEKMGGSLRVSSEPGKGSSFTVDLPRFKEFDRPVTNQPRLVCGPPMASDGGEMVNHD